MAECKFPLGLKPGRCCRVDARAEARTLEFETRMHQAGPNLNDLKLEMR
jgi:hypothetical protein